MGAEKSTPSPSGTPGHCEGGHDLGKVSASRCPRVSKVASAPLGSLQFGGRLRGPPAPHPLTSHFQPGPGLGVQTSLMRMRYPRGWVAVWARTHSHGVAGRQEGVGGMHRVRPEREEDRRGRLEGCRHRRPQPGAQRRRGGCEWRWQVGGRTASGTVPRAQLVGCMRAKRSAASPVTPTAAAAWPASGLGSGPGCSLRCTGSSSGRGPGPPASRSGRVGGGGLSVSLHCSRNSNQTGGGSAAPHRSTRLPQRWAGVAGAPRILPESWPPFHAAGPGEGQRPRAVCVPHQAGWASSRPLGQAGLETLRSPGLSAPCPQPGNEVLAAT